MTKRKRLPLRWVKQLLKRQNGKCAVARCGVVLVLGPKGQHVNFIDEHIVPRALGGKDTFKNRELRCIAHAAQKTRAARGPHTTIDSDVHAIAKVRRIKKGKMAIDRNQRLAQRLAREKAARHMAKSFYRWLGGKLRGRPFPKRKRPMGGRAK
jgi:hypothetical protein